MYFVMQKSQTFTQKQPPWGDQDIRSIQNRNITSNSDLCLDEKLATQIKALNYLITFPHLELPELTPNSLVQRWKDIFLRRARFSIKIDQITITFASKHCTKFVKTILTPSM